MTDPLAIFGDPSGPDPIPLEADDTLRGIIDLASLRAVNGRRFVLEGPPTIEAVWGASPEVLWPKAEPFLLVGPAGVGKTTLAGQVIAGRLKGGDVLGYPVEPDDRPLLLLALDRPAQIARSLARIFTDADAELLAARLVVWRGPLPFDVRKYTEGIATMADQFGAGTIVVDSIKDLAPNISSEETGAQINAAFQIAATAGIEVMGLHHQRKAQAENRKPTSLADVYGSQWIPNGAGSVALLWGEAGDPVVELSHLKQPLEQVGPLTIVHDHAAGTSTVEDRLDAYLLVQGSIRGITAVAVAARLYGKTEPTRNEVEKARRRLDRLAETDQIHCQAGTRGGMPALYFPIARPG